jgi:hypothetical protein
VDYFGTVAADVTSSGRFFVVVFLEKAVQTRRSDFRTGNAATAQQTRGSDVSPTMYWPRFVLFRNDFV